MPSNRKRTRRNVGLDPLTIAIIGVGCGINHMPDAELHQLWREHGAAVTEYWRRKFGPDAETFVGSLARQEGWE